MTCRSRTFHTHHADQRPASLSHRRLTDVYGGQSDMSTRQSEELSSLGRYSSSPGNCRVQTFVQKDSEFELDQLQDLQPLKLAQERVTWWNGRAQTSSPTADRRQRRVVYILAAISTQCDRPDGWSKWPRLVDNRLYGRRSKETHTDRFSCISRPRNSARMHLPGRLNRRLDEARDV